MPQGPYLIKQGFFGNSTKVYSGTEKKAGGPLKLLGYCKINDMENKARRQRAFRTEAELMGVFCKGKNDEKVRWCKLSRTKNQFSGKPLHLGINNLTF